MIIRNNLNKSSQKTLTYFVSQNNLVNIRTIIIKNKNGYKRK